VRRGPRFSPDQFDLAITASRAGSKALREALSTGLDPNARDQFGCVPLTYAIQCNRPRCVAILLESGARPNTRDVKSHTPLHYAAGEPSVASVRMLLEAGAAVNARDARGFTPLHVAAGHDFPGSRRIVRLLLDAGADPRAVSRVHHLSVLHEAQQPAVARMLIRAGAEIGVRATDGRTAAQWARDDERDEVADVLLRHRSASASCV